MSAVFAEALKKRLYEEADLLKDVLAEGRAVQDFAEYKHIVGQIRALRRTADEYCDQVESDLNKR